MAPVLFAVWSLGGFYGSLAPAVAGRLSGSNSMVIGGLGLFVLTVVSSVTIASVARTPARTVMFVGIGLLVLGSLGTLVTVEASSATGFFASTVVSGIGFGAAFPGWDARRGAAGRGTRARGRSLLDIRDLLPGHGPAPVVAGIVVAYGGGLPAATRDYSMFVIVFAIATLVLLPRTSGTRDARRASCTNP